jgi:heavy metal sensor kinase
MTLRTTLTLVYTGILALLLTALSFASYHVLALHLDLDATDDLEKMTGGLHGYLRFEEGMPVLVYDRNDPEEVAFIEAATRYYQVYDANTGRLLVQSAAFDPLGLHYTPAEVQTFRDRSRVYDMHTDEGRVRISSSPISPAPGEAYLLQVGLPLDPIDGGLARFLRFLVWSVPVGLLVAVVTGRWMAGRALAPLGRLAAATRTISVADLRQRLQVRGVGDELDEVADAFNETLTRLDQAVGEMKQFSAALAHELRTPLAALRGEAEFALLHASSPEQFRRGLASQLEELDKLARLINQLLTLARAEAGEIPLARDPVDLAALGATVVEQLEPVARAGDVELACEASENVVVTGDAGWLERLLLNLLDNAIKFTPARGRISLRVSRENGAARLDVRDTGVGIAPDALPHLFERFYRVDPARSRHADGAGLGLALAKWIADRHGATIAVTSRPGEGSTFTVHLPLAVRPGSSPFTSGARVRTT